MNRTDSKTSQNTKIKIDGENNKILLVSEKSERYLAADEVIDGLNLEIKGNNNFIKLELPINFVNNASIKIFSDNVNIVIETSPFLGISLLCCHGNKQICTIKRNTVMVDVSIFLVGNTELQIGEECMLSEGPVYIMPCDGHSILDMKTNHIVNIPTPISIGNHCWIGNSCKIIRGAKLPNNTIVGIGSIVNKSFEEEYTILAGNPAKVIKRERKWDKKNPYLLMHTE